MPKSVTMEMDEITKLTASALSKEEFLDGFRQVIQIIKDLKGDNKSEILQINRRYDDIVSKIQSSYSEDMASVKKQALDYCQAEMDKTIASHEGRMKQCEYKCNETAKEMPAQIDKKVKEMAKNEILPLIPTEEDTKSVISKSGVEIRDALEALPSGDKLEINAIQNLRDELDRLERQISKNKGVSGGGTTGSHNVRGYHIPLSQLNGVTKSFTVPGFWEITSIVGSSFPFTFMKNVDFTSDASASTVTFTSTIDAGVSLLSDVTITILYLE